MKFEDRLKTMSFIIVTHIFATGPADALKDFLLKHKVKTVSFIGHPFYYAPQTRSFALLYKEGSMVKKLEAPSMPPAELLLYFKDLILTLIFAFLTKSKFDIYVGADSLNAFAGLILKQIKLVRLVVFYTIDYVPIRFKNSIINGVYHFFDKLCVEHCDFTWNLSEAMMKARESRGIKKGRQMVVPMGGNFRLIDEQNKRLFDRTRMVFLGNLRRGQGLELIIRSLPQIIKEIPNARLTVIGTGSIEQELKLTVKILRLDKNVEFLGYIPSHAQVEAIISKCAFGLAPYEPSRENFTWYSDPGKVKQYFAMGLPTIITRVPFVAYEIEREGAGIVIDYNEDEFVKAVITVLKDDGILNKCKEKAAILGSKYSWPTIFTTAIQQVLRGKRL